MRKPRRQAEVDVLRSELDDARPYLGLAREIHDEVRRIAEDPVADADLLAAMVDAWPAEARRRVVEAAFHELPAERRWAIVAELFDDDELRAALHRQHERLAADARHVLRLAPLTDAVGARRALDVRDVPADEQLTLGLFREVDVRAALARGSASTTCARRLVLRATGDDGALVVIEDVFNPARGLFVTPEYDEAVWRRERLDPHTTVRVGSIRRERDTSHFSPVIYPGGRVDDERAGALRHGRLHAGFATVAGIELFTGIAR